MDLAVKVAAAVVPSDAGNRVVEVDAICCHPSSPSPPLHFGAKRDLFLLFLDSP
jgi:hypothetical protein